MVAKVLLGSCAAVLVVAGLAGCGSHGTAVPAAAPNAPGVAPPSLGPPAVPAPVDTRASAGPTSANGVGGPAGPNPAGTDRSGTSPAGTRPAVGAAPVSATTCAASALSLTQRPGSNGAAGQIVVAVQVTNHASRACTISGYPAFTLTARASNGKDIAEPVAQRHGSLGSLAFGDPVRTVSIPAGGFSGFLVQYSQVPYGDGGCVPATKLRLTLPGTGAPVTGPVQIQVCGEPMLVSPFVPGGRLSVG